MLRLGPNPKESLWEEASGGSDSGLSGCCSREEPLLGWFRTHGGPAWLVASLRDPPRYPRTGQAALLLAAC